MDYDELLRHRSDNKAANLHALTPVKYADLQIKLNRGLRVARFRVDDSYNSAIRAAKSMLHAEKNSAAPLEQILDDLISSLQRKLIHMSPQSVWKRAKYDKAYNDGIEYAISVFEKERRGAPCGYFYGRRPTDPENGKR